METIYQVIELLTNIVKEEVKYHHMLSNKKKRKLVIDLKNKVYQ